MNERATLRGTAPAGELLGESVGLLPETGPRALRENMVKRERVHGGCLGATVR